MATYGRQVLTPVIGQPISVLANLDDVDWKAGGLTLDWSTVPAVTSDTTFIDQNVLLSGQKGLSLGTILCRITATGYFGPYNSTATDGRQTLSSGDCYILPSTVFQNSILPGLASPASDHPGVFDGGLVWFDRLRVGANYAQIATPTVAPTLTIIAGGSLAAGVYTVGYTWKTADGETALGPTATVTSASSNNQFTAATPALPAGVTAVNWYMSTVHDGTTLAFLISNNGASFTNNALPADATKTPPTTNSTGGQPTLAAFKAAFPRIMYVKN